MHLGQDFLEEIAGIRLEDRFTTALSTAHRGKSTRKAARMHVHIDVSSS